jgi:hypothetical protein
MLALVSYRSKSDLREMSMNQGKGIADCFDLNPVKPMSLTLFSSSACACQKLRMRGKVSRFLRFVAVVSPACIRRCVRSSRLLRADCAASGRVALPLRDRPLALDLAVRISILLFVLQITRKVVLCRTVFRFPSFHLRPLWS